MRKKLWRWPIGLVVAALLLAVLVTSLPLLHNGKSTAAHASGGGGEEVPSGRLRHLDEDLPPLGDNPAIGARTSRHY